MDKFINDAKLEAIKAIEVKPTTSQDPRDRLVEVVGPPDIGPVINMLLFLSQPSALPSLAESVWDRSGIDRDDHGYYYPNHYPDGTKEPVSELRSNVWVFDPFGGKYVSPADFEKLLTMYLNAVISGAERRHDSVSEKPWWSKFVSTVRKIENRTDAEA